MIQNTYEEQLVSILMPTYNVEKYIREAVSSILNQTYAHFELIIVDDGSTDGTYEILKEMAQTDKRIKLFRNEINLKICKTLNRAFSMSKGEYILRMDGDDISLPQRIECLKEYMDEHPEIMIAGSQVISIDENGSEISHKKYPTSPEAIKKSNRFMSSVLHIWIARREVYQVLGGYREIPYAEDYDFLLRGELKGYKYVNVPQYLYKCRIRRGNTGSANGLEQRKAAAYVQKLHKKEEKDKKDHFNELDYHEFIKCTDKQKKQYAVAAGWLNKAVTTDRHSPAIILDLIKAMRKSKYIANYLLSAVMLRVYSCFE